MKSSTNLRSSRDQDKINRLISDSQSRKNKDQNNYMTATPALKNQKSDKPLKKAKTTPAKDFLAQNKDIKISESRRNQASSPTHSAAPNHF
jgi:hypothetical protein